MLHRIRVIGGGMHKAVEQFVERMGIMLEADGVPRIAGRIFGFLMVHAGAYSLDDLAEKLKVSKASVSTNARLMERLGVLERVAAPGDRRDYYQMRGDAWERMLRVAQRKWEGMRRALCEAEESLPGEMAVGRARLLEAESFHRLLGEESERLLERWRTRVGEGDEQDGEVGAELDQPAA
jgi:DNA-binding MarR family transcriptional regulator